MIKRIMAALTGIPLLTAAGLFLAYLLFSWFAMNPLAQRVLPWVGERMLGSRIEVGMVRFDPLSLELSVDDFRLSRADGAPLAGFGQLYVDLQADSLFRFAWHLREVRVSRPEMNFETDKEGNFNWADLIARLNKDSEPSKTMPRVMIDRLQIDDGRLQYAELNRAEAFRTALVPLAFELSQFSTLPDDRGDYLVAADLVGIGGKLRWKGNLGVNPMASTGSVELQGLKLASLLRLAPQLDLPLTLNGGELGLRFDYDFSIVSGQQAAYPHLRLRQLAIALAGIGGELNPHTRVAIQDIGTTIPSLDLKLEDGVQLQLQPFDVAAGGLQVGVDGQPLLTLASANADGVAFDLARQRLTIDGVQLQRWALNATSSRGRMPERTQPIARLERLALSGVDLDLKARTANASELSVSSVQTSVVRNADQSLNWQALLAPLARLSPPSSTSSRMPPPERSTPAASPPDWQVGLAHLRLDKVRIRVEDKTLLQPVAVDLQDASLDLSDVSLDSRKPIALNARLPIRQGGQLDVRGKLFAMPLRGEMQLKLSGLQLKPYSPYLSQFAMLKLTRGKAAAQGRLSFSAGKRFSARFNGGFDVSAFEIAQESDGRPFLSWDKLASNSLRVSLAPDRLHLGELRIVHPSARLIIFEDRTINLQRLLRPSQPTKALAAAPAAARSAGPSAAAAAAGKTSADFPFMLERIRVSDGKLEFADLSLRPQFGTNIHELSGVINGLSNDAAGIAQVELDGKVDDFGSARVRGSIQPFRVTDFTDLKVGFRNLEMNRLTPYSGKFAGRKIDSGKLTVDLEYKLRQRQLVGENKVVINKIKLGERVESRDALKLPLDLAIVLLEDSNGVIDIDLPITGNLDDPQFSYGHIIWKAIFNVIEKVVTAPFRAIGKLLGISSEKLEAVGFDAGSAALLPPEQEKLKAVAGALAKRPTLTLQVLPAFDPAADTAALQELATRRDVAAELGMKLSPGEPVGPLDLSNVKVQTAIANLLKDRSGQKRGLKMVDSVKDYFRKTRPEDLPKYAAQLEQLKATVKVSEAELSALALARAQAVRGYLLQSGGLNAARVSIGEPAKVTGESGAVALKMTLSTSQVP